MLHLVTEYKLTSTGTVQRNTTEIPNELQKNATLFLCMSKKSRLVQLMSAFQYGGNLMGNLDKGED